MKFFALLVYCFAFSLSPAAYAQQQDTPVLLLQMNPDSTLKKPDATQPADSNAGQPQHSMAEDLKQVLEDYRISKLGRANQAVSSQYGGQGIVNNSPNKDSSYPDDSASKANKDSNAPASDSK